jgi:hypothetical protein
MLSPVAVSEAKDSPIDAEIERLGISVPRIKHKTDFMGVDVDFRDWPKVYDAYVRYAGNELKDLATGLGAKDYLDAVVSGGADESELYRNVYRDGPEGSRASFIRNAISRYRKLAQDRIMSERESWPEFIELVNERGHQRAQEKMPQGATLPRFPSNGPVLR